MNHLPVHHIQNPSQNHEIENDALGRPRLLRFNQGCLALTLALAGPDIQSLRRAEPIALDAARTAGPRSRRSSLLAISLPWCIKPQGPKVDGFAAHHSNQAKQSSHYPTGYWGRSPRPCVRVGSSTHVDPLEVCFFACRRRLPTGRAARHGKRGG